MSQPISNSEVRCASACSLHPQSKKGITEICASVLRELGSARPDLVFIFATNHHAPVFETIVSHAADALQTEGIFGCTAESVINGGQEFEGQPALSLWACSLPGVKRTPLRLEFEQTPEGGVFSGFPSDLPAAWPKGSCLVLLADPHTFPAHDLLKYLNEEQPDVPVVGGMASGGMRVGQNRLIYQRQVHSSGAVGVLLHGGLNMKTIVSQGCEPIGKPFVVTKSEGNIVMELGGRPALSCLAELYPTLTPEQQKQIERGLHLGLAMNEYQDRFERGDFLVRNVIGADPQKGVIAIADYVRPGQTVQFHLRDATTADDDFRLMLEKAAPDGTPAGGLLFSCNGRGTRLFPGPHHDSSALRKAWPDLPLSGFFAQGEIGPVGGKNYLHGFTASTILFYPHAK